MGLIILGLILGIIFTIVYVAVTASINNDNAYAIKNNGKEKRRIKLGVVLTLLLTPVLLFTLIASSTRVGTGEIAVMTRFGRVTGQELGEGIHFKSPLDKANIYDIKVQKIDTDAAAASKDLQDVNTKVVLNYDISAGQVSKIHKTVGPLYQEKLIDPAIQEVFKGAASRYDATALITERPSVKAYAYDALKARLKPYGIEVRELSITNFAFSPEFSKAIEAKQVAAQQAEQSKFLVEKSKNEADAKIAAANGDAESQRLLTATASDKSVELKKLEVQQNAINKWNGVLPSTVAGADTLFNIPIKQ